MGGLTLTGPEMFLGRWELFELKVHLVVQLVTLYDLISQDLRYELNGPLATLDDQQLVRLGMKRSS